MTLSETPALIGRLVAGDAQALCDIYDRYASLVNALALRILRDAAEAEDVVQEVFVQIWRQASRFDPSRGSAEAWLCTIARTRALGARREAEGAAERVGWRKESAWRVGDCPARGFR